MVHRASLVERWDRALARANNVLATGGVFTMLVVSIMTVVDILVMRTLLNQPIPGTNEMFAAVFSVGVAAVVPAGLSKRAHLEVTAFERFFGAWLAQRLRAFGTLLTFTVVVLIAYGLSRQSVLAFERGNVTTIFQIPLWPVYTAISAILVWCIPTQLVVFMAEIGKLGQRRLATAAAIVCVWAILGFAAVYLLSEFSRPIAANLVLAAVGVMLAIWVLLGFLVPLGTAMLVSSLLGTYAILGEKAVFSVVGTETLGLLTSDSFAVIPLFLLMGGFAVLSGMTQDIYRLAHALLAPLRGGLALATIAGSAGFGCLTGSSVATVATMGAIGYPEMKRHGYSDQLSTGSIAAGGTLGALIPPSTVIVIYALLVEESIGALYIAVIVPALLGICAYFLAIWATISLNPATAPRADRATFAELRGAASASLPILCILTAVIGGIFFGVFTATEAAAIGAVLAFAVTVFRGRLGRNEFWKVASETTTATAMLYLLIIGGLILTFFIGTTSLTGALLHSIHESGLPAWMIIATVVAAFALLGMFIDSMTIMVVTASSAALVIEALGYSPVWWGVVMVMVVELGVITPPFGINLFMIKSVAPGVPLGAVYKGVVPFVAADMLKLLALLLFPSLALWLPSLM